MDVTNVFLKYAEDLGHVSSRASGYHQRLRVKPCTFIQTATQIMGNVVAIRRLVEEKAAEAQGLGSSGDGLSGATMAECVSNGDADDDFEQFDTECQGLLQTCKMRIESLSAMRSIDSNITTTISSPSPPPAPSLPMATPSRRPHRRRHHDENKVIQKSEQAIAHHLGVIAALYQALGAVASAADALRLHHMARVEQRRKETIIDPSVRNLEDVDRLWEEKVHAVPSLENDTVGGLLGRRFSGAGFGKGQEDEGGYGEEAFEDEYGDATVLLQENEKLKTQMDLMVDTVRQVESKVREISNLSRMFNATLVEQADEVEALYETTLATTNDIHNANEVLRKTTKSKSDFRRMVVFFLVTAASSLLFLDWYSS